MIVVTGATGHLGNVLVRSLLDSGASDVRALIGPTRRTAPIAGLDVETREVDVRDSDALLRAFKGAECVFHLAGIVSIATRGLRRLREINVDGTRNVLAACRAAGVGRLVYTSSVHALTEPPRGTCLDETSPVDPTRAGSPYSKTKAEATLLVMDAVEEGLDAVIVFPSGVIGPWDFGPSPMGRLLLDCSRGRMKAYVDGAYNFVDVRDVAQGLIAAAQSGRQGEGYVLAGHELTVSYLLHSVHEISGAPAPRLRLPLSAARSAGFVMPAYYWAARRPPRFTRCSLRIISSNCSMSYEKARRELGFSPRPSDDTLRDTLDWFREHTTP